MLLRALLIIIILHSLIQEKNSCKVRKKLHLGASQWQGRTRVSGISRDESLKASLNPIPEMKPSRRKMQRSGLPRWKSSSNEGRVWSGIPPILVSWCFALCGRSNRHHSRHFRMPLVPFWGQRTRTVWENMWKHWAIQTVNLLWEPELVKPDLHSLHSSLYSLESSGEVGWRRFQPSGDSSPTSWGRSAKVSRETSSTQWRFLEFISLPVTSFQDYGR
mmetsp:Transcript_26276/g.61082  ORF Transcript_26276/g.61082 Transcript_26276/m.61082 type:complete len:218 (-) Transcript_26276:1432-2085(-)